MTVTFRVSDHRPLVDPVDGAEAIIAGSYSGPAVGVAMTRADDRDRSARDAGYDLPPERAHLVRLRGRRPASPLTKEE